MLSKCLYRQLDNAEFFQKDTRVISVEGILEAEEAERLRSTSLVHRPAPHRATNKYILRYKVADIIITA